MQSRNRATASAKKEPGNRFFTGLPQTEAGVPAPVVDPTVAELAAIQSLDGIGVWLGASTGLTAGLVRGMGGGSPKLQDVVYIPRAESDEVVSHFFVDAPTDDQPERTRELLPIERGHLAMYRRIARLRLGPTAVEALAGLVAASAPTLPIGGPLAILGCNTQGYGNVPAGSLVTSNGGKPKIKLSSIIDPTLDSALVYLSGTYTRNLFAKYVAARGAEPAEECEPTDEQVSALAQILRADVRPYADFAVFGPYGRRLLAKLVFVAFLHLPVGPWLRRELPGPSSAEAWRAAFRVLRAVILHLEACPPKILDNDREFIGRQAALYGAYAWFVTYAADDRVRSEHCPRS